MTTRSTSQVSVDIENVEGSQRKLDYVVDKLADYKDKAMGFSEFMMHKLYDIFEQSIPVDDVKEMPDPKWRAILGLFTCSMMVTVFAYFVFASKRL
jgi:hypothetical protein